MGSNVQRTLYNTAVHHITIQDIPIVHQTPIIVPLMLTLASKPVRKEVTNILDMSVQCLIECIVNATHLIALVQLEKMRWKVLIVTQEFGEIVICIVLDLIIWVVCRSGELILVQFIKPVQLHQQYDHLHQIPVAFGRVATIDILADLTINI